MWRTEFGAENSNGCGCRRDPRDGRPGCLSSIPDLACLIFESNAPVSKQLRQDVGNFVTLTASAGASAATQARAKAQSDCAQIGY
jgi:hypothetical protein